MSDEVQNLNAFSLDLPTNPQPILNHLCQVSYDFPRDAIAEWVCMPEVVGLNPLLQLHDLALQCRNP